MNMSPLNLLKFDELEGMYGLPKDIVPIQSSSKKYLGSKVLVLRIGCFPGEFTSVQEEKNIVQDVLVSAVEADDDKGAKCKELMEFMHMSSLPLFQLNNIFPRLRKEHGILEQSDFNQMQ